MTVRQTRRDLLTAVGTAALASTAGCAASAFVRRKERTETGTIDPGEAGALAATNRLGDLTVRTEARSDVRYRARMKSSLEEKNFDELAVAHRADGDRLAVEAVHHEDGTVTKRDPVLDLTLRVPASLPVAAARADAGDVVVAGTMGDLTVRADSGDVQVRTVAGDIDVRVGAGDVEVRGVEGDVRARADSGDLQVTDVSGFAGGGVDSGDATFTDLGGVDDVGAGSGDLEVEVPALRGDTRLAVGSGDLLARLAPDLDATVSASVRTGDLSASGLGLVVDDDTPGAEARGTLGDGTHDLRVVGGAGDVVLEDL